jgi:hypothetical protein
VYLLAPDILEDVRQLSPAVDIVLGLVGVFLWGFGAWSHRFWLSLAVTVTAGVVGLYAGPDFECPALVAALLLALAAGVLSLALARIGLFLAGGLATLLLLRVIGWGWNEFVCFVVGGLVGVLLYRLWIMVVSSLVGTLLASYAILGLLDCFGRLDSVSWAQRNGPLVNWGLLACVTLGAVIQFALERRRQGKKPGARQKRKKDDKPVYAPPPLPPQPPPPPTLWGRLGGWLNDRAA